MAFTNSPPVNYTYISPNPTRNRNHAIDTFTIHRVVGQCSVETLGRIFAPESRQASSNYGVVTTEESVCMSKKKTALGAPLPGQTTTAQLPLKLRLTRPVRMRLTPKPMPLC